VVFKVNPGLIVMLAAMAAATGRAEAGQTLLLRSMMVADIARDADAVSAAPSIEARASNVVIPEPSPFDEIARESGTVEVEVDITESGALTKCRVIKSSGYRSLDSRATRALQAARFHPAIVAGKPVAGAYAVTIGFDEPE
jgi:TonB family protein